MLHFKCYLEGNKIEKIQNNEKIDQAFEKLDKPMIYMKKWMRTRHAVMLRLSNRIVQVCFNDKTEIILSSETKLVTYLNKYGEKVKHPICWALES